MRGSFHDRSFLGALIAGASFLGLAMGAAATAKPIPSPDFYANSMYTPTLRLRSKPQKVGHQANAFSRGMKRSGQAWKRAYA